MNVVKPSGITKTKQNQIGAFVFDVVYH